MGQSCEEWEWNRKEAAHYQYHQDRYPLFRPVGYVFSEFMTQDAVIPPRGGTALSLNVSNGGLCLLMDIAPQVREVLRLNMPMPVPLAQTPTLAEVRWVRRPPFAQENVYLVGLRFLL